MKLTVLERDDHPLRVAIACDDWKDQANSDPIADVFTATERFIERVGTAPDRLRVTIEVHHALLRHPLMLDRVWNCRKPRALTREDLAAIFDVKEYVVEGDDGGYSRKEHDE